MMKMKTLNGEASASKCWVNAPPKPKPVAKAAHTKMKQIQTYIYPFAELPKPRDWVMDKSFSTMTGFLDKDNAKKLYKAVGEKKNWPFDHQTIIDNDSAS